MKVFRFFRRAGEAKVTSRPLTAMEEAQFDRVFASMDDTFREMNKLFGMVEKRARRPLPTDPSQE